MIPGLQRTRMGRVPLHCFADALACASVVLRQSSANDAQNELRAGGVGKALAPANPSIMHQAGTAATPPAASA